MLSDIKQMLDSITDVWDNLSFLFAGFWLIFKEGLDFMLRLIIFVLLIITSPLWIWFRRR